METERRTFGHRKFPRFAETGAALAALLYTGVAHAQEQPSPVPDEPAPITGYFGNGGFDLSLPKEDFRAIEVIAERTAQPRPTSRTERREIARLSADRARTMDPRRVGEDLDGYNQRMWKEASRERVREFRVELRNTASEAGLTIPDHIGDFDIDISDGGLRFSRATPP